MIRFKDYMIRITLIRFKSFVKTLDTIQLILMPMLLASLIRIIVLCFISIFIWDLMIQFKLLPLKVWIDSNFIWKLLESYQCSCEPYQSFCSPKFHFYTIELYQAFTESVQTCYFFTKISSFHSHLYIVRPHIF